MESLFKIKNLYDKNPEFVSDIINTQYLKTNLLGGFEYAIFSIFHKLNKKTEWVEINLLMLDDVKSYKYENDIYTFECEESEFGFPKKASFYKVFSLTLLHTQNSLDINDMLSKLYSSNEPLLIKLAEVTKKRTNSASELFDIITCEECNINKDWTYEEILNKRWNFKLLALNQKVWQSLFSSFRFSFYLLSLRDGVNTLKTEDSIEVLYDNYIHKINLLIKRMFLTIQQVNSKTVSSYRTFWTCSLCDGDSKTGCLWHDPTECPRKS